MTQFKSGDTRPNGSSASRRGICVQRYVFPFIILAIFVVIIGGAMVLGLWQTKGGQGRGDGGGHEDHSALPAIEIVAQKSSTQLFEEVTL